MTEINTAGFLKMQTTHPGNEVEAQRGLRRQDMKSQPVAQFAAWFDTACGAGVLEPNAMTVATAGADRRISIRLVLLKKFDQRGFVFFTNLESRKSHDISENDRVSLLFPWLTLGRQVVIQGRAERIPTSETLAYFVTRPLGSRLGAWVSQQSSVITSRKLLEMKWEEMKRKFSDGQVPLPSFWGGYRVVPREIEFWQARSNHLHDRFVYRLGPTGWTLHRLAP